MEDIGIKLSALWIAGMLVDLLFTGVQPTVRRGDSAKSKWRGIGLGVSTREILPVGQMIERYAF